MSRNPPNMIADHWYTHARLLNTLVYEQLSPSHFFYHRLLGQHHLTLGHIITQTVQVCLTHAYGLLRPHTPAVLRSLLESMHFL